MECEVFATIPKDVNVNGNTIEHKDIKVDFDALFQTSQNDIYNSYITEKCISQVLVGRNVVHFLVDANLDQFTGLCKGIISTSLEECTKCRVSGYIISSSNNARCLLSHNEQNLQFIPDWTSSPFKNLLVEEIKSSEVFSEKIVSTLFDKVPSVYNAICLTFGYDIIPSSGANITKLFPELSVVLIQTENLYVTKMINDISNIGDPLANKIISISLSANVVGFYLSGNFQCSATFQLRWGLYKNQLTVAKNMKGIKSFPIVNDAYSKGLLTKISLSQKSDETLDTSMVTTLKNDLQAMAMDNVKLMKENEVLHKQIDTTQIDMNNLLNSKQILSDEVRHKLTNEQEIYNKLTEMAVEKVKIKDMSEVKRYELMNKIFSLENDLLNAQIVSEEWKGKYEELDKDKINMESMKNDLQAEYISLKVNHQNVVGKQNGLERKCEQLSLELVQLHMDYEQMSNLKSRLPSSTVSLPQIKSTTSTAPKSSILSFTDKTELVEQLRQELEEQKNAANAEKNKLLQAILNLKAQLNQDGIIKDQQKRMIQQNLHLQGANETHTRKIKALEDQLFSAVHSKESMIEDLNQHKANLNALSIIKSRLEAENVGLRLKQRNAVEEYRVRLDCYIRDTEKFINRKNPEAQLQSHLKGMIEEFKKSYVEREKDLLEELNSTKADLLDTLENFHKISDEYSQVSNTRLVQRELERLRKENKAHSDAVEQGKLLTIEQVDELLKRQQEKYHSTIDKLRTRCTKSETQLNRLLSHIKQ